MESGVILVTLVTSRWLKQTSLLQSRAGLCRKELSLQDFYETEGVTSNPDGPGKGLRLEGTSVSQRRHSSVGGRLNLRALICWAAEVRFGSMSRQQIPELGQTSRKCLAPFFPAPRSSIPACALAGRLPASCLSLGRGRCGIDRRLQTAGPDTWPGDRPAMNPMVLEDVESRVDEVGLGFEGHHAADVIGIEGAPEG